MGCKRSPANGVTVPGATRSCRRRPRATRVYRRPTHNQSARLLRLPRMSLALPAKIRLPRGHAAYQGRVRGALEPEPVATMVARTPQKAADISQPASESPTNSKLAVATNS
ncbi:hypothetical protein MRX96_000430 [Rhipicephalus microplus]